MCNVLLKRNITPCHVLTKSAQNLLKLNIVRCYVLTKYAHVLLKHYIVNLIKTHVLLGCGACNALPRAAAYVSRFSLHSQVRIKL